MPYFETDTHSGVLGFDVKENTAVLSACRGRDTEIDIPAFVEYAGESVPVTGIGKKAFLSNRYLHEITVPESVCKISDWAFAGCRNLKKVSLHRNIELENGVFKDCIGLKNVQLDDFETDDMGYLLASVIFLLEDRYLFDLREAGSTQWLKNWDNRMLVILGEPDEEGFQALLACGEEDYEGRDNTLDAYLNRRRKRKVRVCLLRLLHDIGLEPDLKTRLIDYLRSHGPGCREDETWQVVLEEHGDEMEYYELLCRHDIINNSCLDLCLKDMGALHARMKAYILRECSSSNTDSVFDDMDL